MYCVVPVVEHFLGRHCVVVCNLHAVLVPEITANIKLLSLLPNYSFKMSVQTKI